MSIKQRSMIKHTGNRYCGMCKIKIENGNGKFCSERCKQKYHDWGLSLCGLKPKVKEEENKNFIKYCRICQKPFLTDFHTDNLCLIHIQDYPSKRFRILMRDNFRCIYCGSSSTDTGVKLEVDHIYPKKIGGLDSPDNLVTACHLCNAGKSDMVIPISVRDYFKNKIKELNEYE